MLQTYKAILRGNQLEWNDAAPQSLTDDQPVVVYVTILDQAQPEKTPLTSGQQTASILEELAQQPTLASISDPVAWQNEQRGDRPLPGRDQ